MDADKQIEVLQEILESDPGLTARQLHDSLNDDEMRLFRNDRAVERVLKNNPAIFFKMRNGWTLDPADAVVEEDQPSPTLDQIREIDETTALEKELRERLRGRRLIAEVGLDTAMYERTAASMRELRRGSTLERIGGVYPYTFVTFLAGHALFHYEAGGLWSSLDEFGIDNSAGPLFKKKCRDLGLETFDELVAAENAHEYVAVIVAHGGIPTYCLGDFFELIVKDAGRTSGTAEDLLAFWRVRKSTFQNIDKPVKRFLLYGGSLATDLLDRCLEAVDRFAKSGSIPNPADAGLPAHVLRALELHDIERVRNSGPSSRFRQALRPEIRLDPWSPLGPVLHLPPVPPGVGTGSWTVQSDKEFRKVDASTFEPSEVHLEPARSWTLEFTGPDAEEGWWAFPGLNNTDNPVLFFDDRSGVLLPPGRAIRSDAVWVLGPAGVEFRAVDTNEAVPEVQRLPDLTGSWSGLQVTYLDLSDTSALTASFAGCETQIRVQPAADAPQLLDNAIDRVTTADGRPVFGQFPRVQLPRTSGLDQTSWKVRYVAGDLDIALSIDEDLVVAGPSELPTIVPDALLTVRGPLGSDFKLRFAFAADLELRCPDVVLFPGDRHSEITLSAPQIQVDGRPSGIAAALEDDGHAQVNAQLDNDEATLGVVVRIPRVVWSTVDESRRSSSLKNEVVTATTDDLLDGEVSGVVIQTGRSDLPLTLRLTANGQTLQQSEPFRTSTVDGRWVFDLRRFSDTIRASEAGSFEFIAVVGQRPVTVLRVRASAGISGVQAQGRIVGDDLHGTIQFSCSRRVDGLVARLWPLDRPWGDPVEVSIPNAETETAFSFETSRLPPGAYLAEVAVEDLWSKPTRPSVSDPYASVVHLAHSDDHRARLERLAGGDALDVLEHALATGEISRHLNEAELDEIAGPAVDSLMLFLRDKSMPTPRGLKAVRDLLTMRPSSMVTGLIDRLGDNRTTTPPDRLRLMLQIIHRVKPASIGELDEEALRHLWAVAPPIAAKLDFVSNPHPERVERYQEFLEWAPDDGVDAIAPGAALKNVEVNLPAEHLRDLRKRMDLLPSTLLDKDSLAAAQFEWLIDAHENDIDVTKIMEQQRIDPNNVVLTGQRIRRHFEARKPEQGTLPIASFPHELLRSAVSFCQETGLQSPGRALVNAAAAFAPRLVQHDLVLAQLIQVFSSQEGETS